MSRVSAADLAVFTSRFVPKKQDESKLSADQFGTRILSFSRNVTVRTARPGMPHG
jgi:hypothetical protein